ncbi:APGW-amide-related neuropeptide-like [Ylistrum balloti]|uniref:APGW-amide-related neuropeptide-like n=1 Tax=Ylistrum balloti TaxID=509963 RepID=UPI002905F781|nr:APGW-amide-related neuropeptide-like [Ylistrum balloti]
MDTLTVGIISFILTFNVLSVSSNTDMMDKRRPGWGKRDVQSDENTLEEFDEPDKRRPGWGKRDSTDLLDSSLEKRRPGWGKRSDILDRISMLKRRPGWGKRTLSDISDLYKRRPGWGKRDSEALDMEIRAPGWGKRNFIDDGEYSVYDKRRPGWGKRSDNIEVETRRPGWGKRAPGWGKRSMDVCQSMKEKAEYLISSAIEVSSYHLSYLHLRLDRNW